MEIKFNCDKEDLIGAYLAGFGEDPKIKIKRIVFILMPLLVMIAIAICCQHSFTLKTKHNIASNHLYLLCGPVSLGS